MTIAANSIVPDQRVLRGAAATLTVTLTDGDGTAADATGAVTVAVAKADGTVVLAAGTATTHGTTGVYTVALTPAQTSSLELLTVTWTDAGDASIMTTLVEIAGGYLFSVADARASDSSLTDTSRYPTASILATRIEVEDECEDICDVAFVPRYRRVVLDGDASGLLALPNNRIRRVRSVRLYTDLSSGSYTALTADQLADLSVDDDNRIERTDSGIFLEGRGNVVVEYEHGYDRPEADLKRAAMRRLRNLLNQPTSGIPDEATSYTDSEGQTFQLARPKKWETGIVTVDAVYGRHSLRSDDDGPSRPAGRRIDYDPQYYSLFHPGRR